MFYEWDSFLETGCGKIDVQHRQLFEALNALLEACTTGTASVEVERAVDFLLAYTVKHFADEEALQKAYDYPDYLRHKQIHGEFKQVANELARRLYQEGPSESLVGEVYRVMGDWLLNHVKGDDFRLATYIKSKLPT